MGIPDSSLQDRVCIVTGAARGLGLAMSQALVGAGARVVAVDTAMDDASPGGNSRLLHLRADVSAEEQCRRIVDQALRRFGAIHVLVNNAGLGTRSINAEHDVSPMKFWELPVDGWRRVIEVNINGVFLMAHAVAPIMIASGFGRIVNISTGWVTMARYGDSPYGPSKAALESCTAIWAKELASTGVTCNALAPGGPVDTSLARGPVAGRRKGALLSPEIMAEPILWLASDRSAAWTGRRFVATDWDSGLPPDQAAAKSASPARELPAII